MCPVLQSRAAHLQQKIFFSFHKRICLPSKLAYLDHITQNSELNHVQLHCISLYFCSLSQSIHFLSMNKSDGASLSPVFLLILTQSVSAADLYSYHLIPCFI